LTTSAASQALTIAASQTLNLASGGLLFTGTNDYTITGGTLSSLTATNSDLLLHQFGSGNLTIASIIANGVGASTLTKDGPGLVTLSSSNSYTGATYITGGTLSISNNNQLGVSSTGATMNLRSGGVLQWNAATSGTLDNAGANKRAISIGSGGGGFDVVSSGTLTVTGAISATGMVTKSGLGTLVLNGGNTMSGGVTINDGTVTQGNTDAISNVSVLSHDIATNNLIFGNGTAPKLQLNTYNANVTSLVSGNTNAVVENGGATASTLTVYNGADNTFAGILRDGGGAGKLVLAKTGGGTLFLTNTNNTFSGGLTIYNGVVSGTQSGTLGSAPIVLAGGGLQTSGSFSNTLTISQNFNPANSAALDYTSTLDTGTGAATFSGALSGTGGLIKAGSGTLTLTNATSTYGGSTTVSQGTLQIGANGTTGSITGASGISVASGANLTFARTDSYGGNFTTAIGGSGSVAVNSGVLTLSASNTYTGATAINGGILLSATSAALATTGTVTVGSAGTLAVRYGGASDYASGDIATLLAKTAFAASTAAFGLDTTNLSGTLGSSLSFAAGLTKLGANTLTLTGSNSYSGATTVSAGTLVGVNPGTDNALSAFGSGPVIIGTGATIQLKADGSGSGQTILAGNNVSLSGTAGIDVNFWTANGGSTIALGTLAMGAAGQLNVTGANTYALSLGATTLSGAATFNPTTANLTLGAIGESVVSSLTKIGTGTLFLTGSSTYSGATTITAGKLQVGNGTDSGSLDLTSSIVDNAALVYNVGGGNRSLGANVSGSGTLTQQGAGTLTLTGSNTYTGATTISAGTLQIGAGTDAGSINSTSAITDNGALVYNVGSGNRTLGLNVSGSGTLTQQGAGTLTLTGSNTYTGSTIIGAGTLQIGSGTDAGSFNSTSAVLDNGALVYNVGSGNRTLAANVSGSGSLTQQGTGTLTLTGSNSFTGVTSLNGGFLSLGGSNALAGGGNISFNGGILQYTGSNTVDYSSRIKNSTGPMDIDTYGQTVTFAGNIDSSNVAGLILPNIHTSGTLVLTGSNAYTGDTKLIQGTLALANPYALAGGGNIVFAGFGTLQFSGSNTQDYSARIKNSSSAVSLDTNGQNVTFAAAIDASNTAGLTKLGAGTLMFTTNMAYSGTTTVSAGTLQLGDGISANGSVSGTGNIVNNGAVIFAGPATSGTYSGTLSGSGSVTKGAAFANLTLNGTSNFSGLTINSGTVTLGPVSGSVLSGTITLNSATLSATGARTLTVAGLAVNTSGTLQLATYDEYFKVSSLTGSGALTVTGSNIFHNELELTGTTNAGFSGSITIPSNAGIYLANEAALGSNPNALTCNGILQPIGGPLTIASHRLSGALTVYGNTTLTGGISGSGVTFRNGTITVGGTSNDYTGNTQIYTDGSYNSTLQLAADNALPYGSGKGNLTFATSSSGTAELDLNGHNLTVNGLSYSGTVGVIDNVSAAGKTPTLTVGANDATGNTFSGIIQNTTGSISLVKTGTGTQTLSGNNSYTGVTTISAGTLALGSAGALGGGGNITFGGGTLQFSGSNTGDYSAKIVNSTGAISLDTNGQSVLFASPLNNSNNGGLTKLGAGTLTLSASNTYAGVTTISAGTLALGSANALAGGGNITFGGGTLQFSGSNTGDYSTNIVNSTGAISLDTNGQSVLFASPLDNSNTGGLTKLGAGTLTLTGSNTYSGDTVVSSGTLAMGNVDALNQSTLNYNNQGGQVSLGGLVSANLGGLKGGQNLTLSNTAGNAVALTVGGNNASTVYSGTLGGSGSINKTGSGAFTLSGSNTYTGVTTISSGTLALGSAGALAGGGNITFGGGTLQFSGSNTGDYSAKIVNSTGAISLDTNSQSVLFASPLNNSNNSGLTKLGAGTLTLSASNTYAGVTTISAGTLALGSAGALAGGGNITFGGGTLQFSGSNTGDYSAKIVNSTGAISLDTNSQSVLFASPLNNSNIGGLTKLGAGTLTLTGSNSYSGDSVVSSGTLAMGNVDALNQSTLNYNNQGGKVSFGGLVSANLGGLKGGQSLTLSNTASNAVALNVGGNNASTVYSGTLGGSGSINKTGSGVLTLSGSNTYTGVTTISAGTLALGGSGALAGGGNITFGGGTLQFSASNTRDYSAKIVKSTGAISLDTNNQSVTFASSLNSSNSNGLTKNGLGTLTLTASNSYGGTTTVAGGILVGTNTGTSNALFAFGSGPIVISNGASIQLKANGSGSSQTIVASNNVTLSGTTGIDVNRSSANSSNTFALGTLAIGAGLLNVTGGNTYALSFGATTLSGAVTFNPTTANLTLGAIGENGSSSLTKTGAGNLTLTGSNSYTGTTTVNAGILFATNTATNNALSAFGSGSIVIANGASIQLKANGSGSGQTIVANNNVSVSGTTGIDVNCSTANSSNTFALGTLAIGAGQLNVTGANLYALSLGATTLSGAATFNPTTANLTLGAIGESGASSLTKTGAGTLTLTGSDSYSGDTMVSSGTLAMGNVDALSQSTLNYDNQGGIVSFASLVSANLGGLKGGQNLALSNTAGNAVALTAGGNNTSTAYSGTLSGSGSLTKAGAGVFTLSGSNSYSGGTRVSAGTLQIGNANALGTGAVTMNAGTLDLNGANLSAGAISGSTGAAITNNSSNPASLTTVIAGGSALYAGAIVDGTGTVALVKSGTGALTLSGSNNYSGGTTIVGGTLQLGGNNAIGTGALAVNGGTLDLNGNAASVAGLSGSGGSITNSASGTSTLTAAMGSGTSTYAGNITNGTGAVVLTNSGAGTLILGGSLTMAGLNAQAGVTQLTQSGSIGAVNVSAGATLSVAANGDGNRKVLNVSALTISGFTSGLAMGQSAAIENVSYTSMAAASQSQNTSVLTAMGAALAQQTPAANSDPAPASPEAVPEPGSFGLFLSGALGLLGLRRKKYGASKNG